MAADAPTPPAEFPGYEVVEQLARTELSVVYGGRSRSTGAPVVIKTTPPGVDALVSLAFAREARVLADVRSRHTARVIEVGEVGGQPFLVLERVRGPSLETALAAGRPTFVQAVSVLAQLARGLADVHARDLIHGDVKPGNVLLELGVDGTVGPLPGGGSRALLIDFGLATAAGTRTAAPTGTPHYMAPEQTGIVVAAIDARADLYGLGCLAYELLTGSPPFLDADLGALLRAHVSREPAPLPSSAVPAPIVGEMVLRLLAKAPEARYRSAASLAHDLEQVLRRLDEGDPSPRFPLDASTPATDNISRVFVGRAEELGQLEELRGRADVGRATMALIGGLAGIGKSSLLREFRNRSLRQGAIFASSKCYEFSRGLPYFALAEALAQLVAAISALARDEQDAVRASVQTTVGELAGELVRIAPAFRAWFPDAAAAAYLGEGKDQIRMQQLMVSLLPALRPPGRTLVLDIDDLQWADFGTLKVLDAIASTMRDASLLIIGTFRSEEVDDAHPVRALAARPNAKLIQLRPFDRGELRWMIAEILRVPSSVPPDNVVELIFARSEGNPLFVGELLGMLLTQRIVEVRAGELRVDDAALARAELPTSVVDVVLGRLRALGAKAQALLGAAALVGTAFSLPVVAAAAELPLPEAFEVLGVGIAERLVHPPRDALYRFQHDRIQQACALAIDDRAAMHARILTILEQAPDADAERPFMLVEHALRAGDRARVFRYAAAASELAFARHAIAHAIDYARHGLSHAEGQPAAAVQGLRERLATLLVATGAYPEAIALYRELLDDDQLTPTQRAVWMGGLGSALHRSGQPREARAELERALALVGEGATTSLRRQRWGSQLARLRLRVGGQRRPSAEEQLALDLMAKLWPILFTTDSAAAPALAYRMLALSVRGGPSADLSRAHRNLTLSLAVVWPPDYPGAIAHGRQAVEAGQGGGAPLDAAIGMLYTSDIFCWSARYREALPWLENARSSLTVLGNMWELANTHIFSFLAYRGMGRLDDALAHARSLAELGDKLGARSTVANGRQKIAEVLLLRGERLEAETHLGASLELADRAGFNFERFNGRKLRGLEALQGSDYPAARDAYDAAIRVVETKGVSFFQGYYGDAYLGFAEAVLLDDDLLARAGLDGDDGKRAAEYVQRWRRRETRLRGHLVTAWRVEGILRARQRQARAARQAFDRAIALAREQERPVELAAALASAARWSDARPETRRTWLHEARAICERLGLAPLATDVRRQLTDLGEVLALPADGATQPGDARALEAMTSLIATTELLMQTRDVELLLERIAVASATLLKAERALIFLADAEAAARLAEARDAVQMPAPMGAPGSLPPAPAKMTFHLGRTLAGDPVSADDANVTHTVIDQVQARRRGLAISNTGDDEVLRERRSVLAYQVRSVLCVPLLHAGQVLGVLYVDSQITQMLFGDADLQLLQTFATQAAIALASARQFATIEANNRELDLKVLDRTRALETANQRIEASLIELRDTTLALAVAQREALEKELEVARQIQLAMVPGHAPIATPGAELAGYLEPATQCGGDLWTYAVGGSGQVLLFVGDVTGHGTGSAMIATVAKACIDTLTLARDSFELDGLARTLHAVIASSGKERLMMTAFAAVIDPARRELRYVTAGHLPQFLVRAKAADQLHGRSTRLGDASAEVVVAVQTTSYEPGDRLVLFTDGITERTSPSGEEYGNRRLRRVLTAQRAASPAATRDAIIADVEAFAAGTPSGDDVTIVIADLR